MDLSVREAAKLLAVSEETVYRWIRSGSLPAHRLRHQQRLNRVELQEWAAAHNHPVRPELLDSHDDAESPSLHAALERGGVHANIVGSQRAEVLAAITRLPTIPERIDRELLLQLLLAREALAGSSIGEGIAIPHPRDPLVLQLSEPVVLLCLLAKPVDFGALDGKPVHSLFMVLSPSVRAHLRILAKIAFVIHDDVLRRALANAARDAVILERVRELEQRRDAR